MTKLRFIHGPVFVSGAAVVALFMISYGVLRHGRADKTTTPTPLKYE